MFEFCASAPATRGIPRGRGSGRRPSLRGLGGLYQRISRGPEQRRDRDLLEAIAHPMLSLAAAPYLVEASLLSGDPVPATTAVDALAGYAEHPQDPLVLGLVARSRALLAGHSGSTDVLFLEVLRYQTEHPQPFERAWTALAYGEFLRREQRKMEAHVRLRDALTTFEGLGTPVWAQRRAPNSRPPVSLCANRPTQRSTQLPLRSCGSPS